MIGNNDNGTYKTKELHNSLTFIVYIKKEFYFSSTEK
jgi:hypothetical protein